MTRRLRGTYPSKGRRSIGKAQAPESPPETPDPSAAEMRRAYEDQELAARIRRRLRDSGLYPELE